VKAEPNATAHYQTSIHVFTWIVLKHTKEAFPPALILSVAAPQYWARDNKEQLKHHAVVKGETAPGIDISGE
jgi:hypothetical protein